MSEPQTPLLVRVARKHTEALDICSLDLVAEPGHSLPPFSAGAHIDVALPNGLVRQYSLCNPPGETGRYQIAVLRDAASRGGSQAVHEAVAEGATLHISAPKNHFPLATDAAHHLLLAGGIGITPLLAMAEHLASHGESFELHHCTRSRERTPFTEEALRDERIDAIIAPRHDRVVAAQDRGDDHVFGRAAARLRPRLEVLRHGQREHARLAVLGSEKNFRFVEGDLANATRLSLERFLQVASHHSNVDELFAQSFR